MAMVPVKAPRNDIGYASTFPRRDTPELCRNFSPQKREGVGNAGCSVHPQPRVQSRKHTS